MNPSDDSREVAQATLQRKRRDDIWPLPGIEAVKPDRLQFRNAMARVGSAVHIVTTDGIAGVAGITANAVTSVSDDPPTMLICVNRSSHSAPRFFANGVFCINTLAAADQSLADDFAGRTGLHLDARFEHGTWVREVSGAPILTSAIATFECRIIDLRDIATHHVIIGDVLAVRYQKDMPSLGYHDRRYLTL